MAAVAMTTYTGRGWKGEHELVRASQESASRSTGRAAGALHWDSRNP